MKWNSGKIGDHCEITSSKRIFLSDYVGSGIPFWRSKEVIEQECGIVSSESLYISFDKYNEIKNRFGVPQIDDMLLTSVGTIGVPYIVKNNDPFYFKDGNLTWFRNFSDTLSSHYLYYWIKSNIGHQTLNNLTIGSSQKALTIDALKKVEIPLPDVETQHRIASILSAYDDLIENNRRQIKLLEEAAQRLYREWFVALRFPGHENVKIVDGVPEGWKAETVGNVCSTIGGGTPSTKEKSYYEGGNIPWVTPTDITHNGCLILLETEKKITKEGLAHSSAKMVPAWTILMTSRASVGYFGMCEFPVCTNQGFISCIPYQENMRFYLLHNLMNRVDEIRAKAGGSTYLEISKSTFRDMKIIVPADEILNLFEESIQKLMMKTKNCKEQIGILTSARDRLLPKLMSGEIEV